jgi:hypothetical protein
MAAQYQEIGRIKVNDTTDICVSMVKTSQPVAPGKDTPDGSISEEIIGINVNEYIRTPRYTGYTKATFIPNDKIAEFHRLIGNIL